MAESLRAGTKTKKTPIGEIPVDWDLCVLNSCIPTDAPICYGILKPGPYFPDGVPVIKVKDIENGIIKENGLFLTSPEIDAQYKRSRLRSGDILLTIRGSTGGVARIPESLDGANITQDTARLRTLDSDSADFVYYALQGAYLQRQIQHHTIGQAVKGINIAEVRKLKIVLPPLPERKAITAILSAWDRAIAQTAKLIEAKRKLKKGLMQQLLTGKRRFREFVEQPWTRKTLGSLCSIRTGKKDVNEGNPIGKYPFFTCAKEHTYSDSYSYDMEALLVAGNAAIGTTHYVNGKFEAYQRTYILSDFRSINARYLMHYLKHALPQMIGRLKQESAMSFIRVGMLRRFKVDLPIDSEQKSIALVLDQADREIDLLVEKRRKLEVSKRGLMQKLLTGQVRVNVSEEATG